MIYNSITKFEFGRRIMFIFLFDIHRKKWISDVNMLFKSMFIFRFMIVYDNEICIDICMNILYI